MDLKFKNIMKKIFLTLATAGILTTSAFAKIDGGKKTETATVSYSVQNEFDEQFDNATSVKWTVTSNCQKASFLLNGSQMTAFYNLQGEYIGVTEDVAYSAIGSKAQKEIAEKYKGFTAGEVIKLITNDPTANFDQVVYFVDLKNDSSEELVRVTPSEDVYFFKQVK
jgi:hypothetical protein